MKMTLKTRLSLLIGFLSLLSLTIGLLGLFGITKSNKALQTVYLDRAIPLAQLAEIDYLVQRNRVLVMDMMLQPTPINVEKRNKELHSNIEKAAKIWAEYMATKLTTDEEKLAKIFTERSKAYIQEALVPAADAMLRANAEAASNIYNEKISALAPAMQAAAQNLIKLQVDVAKEEFELASANYVTMRSGVIGAIILGAVLAALYGFFLIRSIYRQLGGEPEYAATVVRSIAEGDLSVTVTTRENDQQSLLFAMHGMQQHLAKTVGAIRTSTDTIATASSQIAAGNLDLSSRTEEQASSLEETASSMEELTVAVKHNSDNARQANQLAISASEVALKGGAVVSKVVDTMSSINASSRKIVDIIAVIDGIAFQTNILALNAAVEAARAGEEGRGFAVVATEVRNLAQRSAAAAKEIKTLITDSVEQVEIGSGLVDEAGTTMQAIVNSIRSVTDIMGEITVAGQEQTAGIEQVNQAIAQMDQTTQQNAALVEQAAAAASSLEDQASSLAELVSVFKLVSMQDTRLSFAARFGNHASDKSNIVTLVRTAPRQINQSMSQQRIRAKRIANA
jgi:methyl-accepting chemotaxis protein